MGQPLTPHLTTLVWTTEDGVDPHDLALVMELIKSLQAYGMPGKRITGRRGVLSFTPAALRISATSPSCVTRDEINKPRPAS